MMKEIVDAVRRGPQGQVHRLLGDHRARPRLRHADARHADVDEARDPLRTHRYGRRRRLRANGQKSAWVSNGTIATHALAFLGVDRKHGHGRRRRRAHPAQPARRHEGPAAQQDRPARAQPGRDLLRRRPHPEEVHARAAGGVHVRHRLRPRRRQRLHGLDVHRPRARRLRGGARRTRRTASRAACRSPSTSSCRRSSSTCS